MWSFKREGAIKARSEIKLQSHPGGIKHPFAEIHMERPQMGTDFTEKIHAGAER